MKILGIDPGSIKCGYGLISVTGNNPAYVTCGTITASAGKPLHERLDAIFHALVAIVRDHKPSAIVVEKIFFAKDARAALNLGHARGIVLLAAASENVSLHECTALEVKKSIVGYGRAEKTQVMEMVRVLLGIREALPPDSADALALALCYANTLKLKEAIRRADGRQNKR